MLFHEGIKASWHLALPEPNTRVCRWKWSVNSDDILPKFHLTYYFAYTLLLLKEACGSRIQMEFSPLFHSHLYLHWDVDVKIACIDLECGKRFQLRSKIFFFKILCARKNIPTVRIVKRSEARWKNVLISFIPLRVNFLIWVHGECEIGSQK